MSECNECKLVAMGKGRPAMCYDCLENRNVELESDSAALKKAYNEMISQSQDQILELQAGLAELKANSADAMSALMDEVHESKKNAAFFRCCALSGEVPKDGAEPHPKKEYEPPSKELLAALLQEEVE